jgi:hypothetical protein
MHSVGSRGARSGRLGSRNQYELGAQTEPGDCWAELLSWLATKEYNNGGKSPPLILYSREKTSGDLRHCHYSYTLHAISTGKLASGIYQHSATVDDFSNRSTG